MALVRFIQDLPVTAGGQRTFGAFALEVVSIAGGGFDFTRSRRAEAFFNGRFCFQFWHILSFFTVLGAMLGPWGSALL